MKRLWEYSLPDGSDPRDLFSCGPIRVHQDRVYFSGSALIKSQRKWVVRLYRLYTQSGRGECFEFDIHKAPIPNQWALFEVGQRLLFHAGALIDCTGEPVRIHGFPTGALAADKGATRPEPLVRGTRLYSSNLRTGALTCFDAEAARLIWTKDLTPIEPYAIGSPLMFGDTIACFGQGDLLLLDRDTGELMDRLKVPRIDKLYSPIADGDDLLLGYTNWSVTGVLRMEASSRKVKWRYRRSFEGPNNYCRIWMIHDLVILVKGGGREEIIGLDAETGEERWRVSTYPWLYTRLRRIGDDLLFGTSGGSGAGLRRICGLTGELRWERILNGGCTHYALQGDRLYAGDYDGFLRCMDLNSGAELDRLGFPGPLSRDIVVHGARIYTTVCTSDTHPAPFVCIDA